jgi:hypothetical protein
VVLELYEAISEL